MLDQVRERLVAASDLYQDDILILRSLLKLEYSGDTTGYQLLQTELSRLMRSNLTYAVTFTKAVCDASINEVPQCIRDQVIRDVAQGLGNIRIDMRSCDIVESQPAIFEKSKNGNFAERCPVAKHSAVELGEFTKLLYGSGLYKPVESMLADLRSEMDHALPMDLHVVYIPFLQELIGLMLMYGIPLTSVVYSAFFESVLQNYLQRFVGQKPKQGNSAEHNSWTPRAAAACHRLESFDHSYFRDILGDRYTIAILPALLKLQDFNPIPQVHSRFDSPTTLAVSETGGTTTSPLGHKK